ncbi:hypothetical protein CFAM422_005702 [Trichoderma lentiforme]|uniref:Uncharacterized protein n=1 Tax=Trichoderma lentiforme TaxID=1567552 RepID=A0A9P5CFB1_9HYPO|nr:hypothetical protein CFAM422_005702 [Trichoderma lentiforme]
MASGWSARIGIDALYITEAGRIISCACTGLWWNSRHCDGNGNGVNDGQLREPAGTIPQGLR